MSLWFPLMVNDERIGTLVIRRTSNTETSGLPPGTVSTYLVTRDTTDVGTVWHRYGDGPWALIRAALALPGAVPRA